MSEPTAEQIEMEREEAHALPISGGCFPKLWNGNHSVACDDIATALARVRIEAHAAGRDEVVTQLAPVLAELEWQATLVPFGTAIRAYWVRLADAIRALRGRT